MESDKSWTDFCRAVRQAGTELAYPPETLVRLFRASYILGGRVAKLVEIGVARLSIWQTTLSGRLNKRLLSGGAVQALPAVDLAQRDLSAGHQGPEEHASGGGAGRQALGLDAALELRALKPGGSLILSSTGPEHKILQDCGTLGYHRYQLGRADDFRKGNVHFLFDSQNYVRSISRGALLRWRSAGSTIEFSPRRSIGSS